MTALRSFLALLTSRRVRVVAVLVALFAARWRLLGQPTEAELAEWGILVVLWFRSESERRHQGAVLRSRRLLAALVGVVLPGLVEHLPVALSPEAVTLIQGMITTAIGAFLFGEGARRHPDVREPAAVVPLDGDGAARTGTEPRVGL